MLKTLGMDPGLEFKVAMEEAQKLRARIVYGDANVEETMRRISQSLRMQASHDVGWDFCNQITNVHP